jgi:glutathione S-transferase
MDSYLWWVWFRVTGAGFPGGDYPAFADHARRMEGLPQVQRMLAREAAVLERLASEGMSFTPPPLPA